MSDEIAILEYDFLEVKILEQLPENIINGEKLGISEHSEIRRTRR